MSRTYSEAELELFDALGVGHLARDPGVIALSGLLQAQDQERLNATATVNRLVPERRERKGGSA